MMLAIWRAELYEAALSLNQSLNDGLAELVPPDGAGILIMVSHALLNGLRLRRAILPQSARSPQRRDGLPLGELRAFA